MVTITNTSNNQSLQIVDYLQTILSLVILLENDCDNSIQMKYILEYYE